jgi:hypothetical protein
MKPFLSIVIPVCDEGKDLSLTLVDIDRRLKTVDYSCEVVVVDGDPSDAKTKMMEKFKKFFPYLRAEGIPVGGKKGSVVKSGMLSARGNYRLFIDVKMQVPLGWFAEAIPLFKDGAEVVLNPRNRFWCFSEEAAERVFRAVSVKGEGIGFEAAVLARLMNLKVAALSIPDAISECPRPKFSARLSVAKDIVAVKLNILLHRYTW